MISEKILSAAEAVLFVSGDPTEDSRLASAIGASVKEIDDICGGLNRRYESTGSSLRVMKLGDCRQLAVRDEFSEYVKAAAETKKNTPLSPAAMEVLTIVAYNQPVSKSFVEKVRGIDSSSVVNSLTEKNLLEEAGRLDVPGRPVAYRTTPVFLRCFGMESLDDLPPIPNFKKADFSELLTEEPAGDGSGEE